MACSCAGVYGPVANRIPETLGTVGIESDVMITDGVAKNAAIIKQLADKTGLGITVPLEP
jgi:activator of 2-hydroxyglutaryl-CoA dehydratase